ncbi:hypothetical protein IAD21_04796 [Abditibacteriota bacterium]|nr:hypothetical protein IAD21_04796 [Abditibacteriota bacterium]
MEHKMLWGAFAVGCAGWLCLLLLAPRGAKPTSSGSSSHKTEGSPFEWLGLALPILVWLATLPTKAPFSAGQGWGRGFLLGGLIAFISSFIVLRTSRASRNGRHLAATSLFGALIVACVPLLWMRHAVIEALLGASLGWCVVSLVWLCAPQSQGGSPEKGATPSAALGLLNGSAFATVLCSVAALGVYRDFGVPDIARGTHSAVAVVLAASIGLALLVGMLLNEASRDERNPTDSLPRLFQTITILLCLIVPLGLGFLMATRVLDDIKLVYCLGIGAVLSLLGWGLLWDAAHRDQERPSQPMTMPPVAILIALCAFMLAYSFLQGFGVGLMLLAAWPISLLLWPTPSQTSEPNSPVSVRFDVAQTASLLGTFLAILLVSRVFATRYRADLRAISLVDQFALFGFLAGALAPTWLASLWFKGKAALFHQTASLLQFAGIGILTLLLPSALLAIWGIKVIPAFFAGMALAAVGWGGAANAPARACATAVFAQSLALVITQWTLRFLPLAEASRAQRMHFLLWGLGGGVVLILVVDIVARLMTRLQQRAAVSEPTPGVSS